MEAMISYLSGKIILKKDNFVILETNGVGYQVFVSAPTMESIANTGENLKLFCYLDVNERSLKLFGFLKYEQLEFFSIVRNITGVGPRAALEIVSVGSQEYIKKELDQGHTDIFDHISGIGKKKAQKIILELSGELKSLNDKPNTRKDGRSPTPSIENDEAFLALCQLGFPKDKCKEVLSQLPQNMTDPQQKIKQSLQILGK